MRSYKKSENNPRGAGPLTADEKAIQELNMRRNIISYVRQEQAKGRTLCEHLVNAAARYEAMGIKAPDSLPFVVGEVKDVSEEVACDY